MPDYNDNPIYHSYLAALEYLSNERGYRTELVYNYFENPTTDHNDEILYNIFTPVKQKTWLYFLLGSRVQYASFEVDSKYIANVDTSVFNEKISRNSNPNCKLVFSDFSSVKKAFDKICDNFDKSVVSNGYTSDIRKYLTLELFEKAFVKFLEQADRNKDTDKANGEKIPYGFKEGNNRFDGQELKLYFGQGRPSDSPFMNWWAVSIYYITKKEKATDGKNIAVGIREGRKPVYDQIGIKPIKFRRIAPNNQNVAIYYETTKEKINYSDLLEHFLCVCEKIIRLGLQYMDTGKGQLNLLEYENEKSFFNSGGENTMKNIILYGPPGTGKTYNTVCYAVAICERKNPEEIIADAKKNYADVKLRYDKLKEKGRIEFTTFHQSYGYEEFIEGIRPVMAESEEIKTIEYEVTDGIFKSFCDKNGTKHDLIKMPDNADSENAAKESQPSVFIIDEINRGNISKIFGELITLIEPSKRIGQLEVLRTVLPYSKKPFGVPDNVYIIGTMNTADRSIATIDTALRRRFAFKEMLPDATVLGGVEIDGINIENMLDSMNRKISVLFDREHTIGHAYFIDLLNEENRNIETLGAIFKNNIIPLLQEYFYEDYEKIRLVLGDNRKKNGEPQFIRAIENDLQNLFDEDLDMDIPYRYEINEAAFENTQAYKYI